MSVAEIMDSSTHLTLWSTVMIVPESSIITDDAEIIVKETELNVSLKGRTTNAVAYQKPNAVVSLDFDRPAPAATATETAEAPSRCPP